MITPLEFLELILKGVEVKNPNTIAQAYENFSM